MKFVSRGTESSFFILRLQVIIQLAVKQFEPINLRESLEYFNFNMLSQ